MVALQTERHLHELLHSKVVMKNEITDKKEGEWYYDIKQILITVLATRAEEINKVVNLEHTYFFISDEANILTRSNTKQIPKIIADDQSSKLKGLKPRFEELLPVEVEALLISVQHVELT